MGPSRAIMWGLLTAFVLSPILDGCATAPAVAPPVQATQTTTVTVQCLPLKAYDLATEKAVAAELKRLPAGDPLAGFIADYGAMRKADKACLAK